MIKKTILAGLTVITLLVLSSDLLAQTPHALSAHEILQLALAATEADPPTTGIEHVRAETYNDYFLPPDSLPTHEIRERYLNRQTEQLRDLTWDATTNRIQEIFDYDGKYEYWLGNTKSPTIYRALHPQLHHLVFPPQVMYNQRISFLEQLYRDPDSRLVGIETWAGDRKVYRVELNEYYSNDGDPLGLISPTLHTITLYIDTKTYRQAGCRIELQENGRTKRLFSSQETIYEILPENAPVAWDLNDLEGFTFIDSSEDFYPTFSPDSLITEEELARYLGKTYLLPQTPAGYTLEIYKFTSSQNLSGYLASYHSSDNDYFIIENTYDSVFPRLLPKAVDTYTTPQGLKFYYFDNLFDIISRYNYNLDDHFRKHYSSAIAVTPDNQMFWINSTLPLDTFKAWTQTLTAVTP